MYDYRIFLIFGAVALVLLFGMGKRANTARGPNLGDAVLPLLGFVFFCVFFLFDLIRSLNRGTPTTLETVWGADHGTAILIDAVVPATIGLVFLVVFIRSVLRSLRAPKPGAPVPPIQSH